MDNYVPRSLGFLSLMSLLSLILLSCGGGAGSSNTPPPPPPPPANVAIPLIDMQTSQSYLGFQGNLYENNSNTAPSDHAAVGNALGQVVRPLDANGNSDPNGKVGFISIGMSNAYQESNTFRNQIQADPRVRANLLFVTAAQPEVTACYWATPFGTPGCGPSPSQGKWCNPSLDNPYDIARDCFLTPAGLTEKQVEVIWLKEADKEPGLNGLRSLCDASQPGCVNDGNTDAIHLEALLADDVRAARVRYPNLKQVFFASRTYGGYATIPLNPEPYAYESGFAVKWLIQAQINQMRGLGTDPVAGDLNYGSGSNGVAPWVAWGAYIWANGPRARSDGFAWCNGQPGQPCNGSQDVDPTDGTHPAHAGEVKVANLLENFFLSSSFSPWF
jgi:hypothetical protein